MTDAGCPVRGGEFLEHVAKMLTLVLLGDSEQEYAKRSGESHRPLAATLRRVLRVNHDAFGKARLSWLEELNLPPICMT